MNWKAILKWVAAAGAAGALKGLQGVIDAISGAAPADVDAVVALIVSAAVVWGANFLISKIKVPA